MRQKVNTKNLRKDSSISSLELENDSSSINYEDSSDSDEPKIK